MLIVLFCGAYFFKAHISSKPLGLVISYQKALRIGSIVVGVLDIVGFIIFVAQWDWGKATFGIGWGIGGAGIVGFLGGVLHIVQGNVPCKNALSFCFCQSFVFLFPGLRFQVRSGTKLRTVPLQLQLRPLSD